MTKAQNIIIGIGGAIVFLLILWIFWYVSQTELSTQLSTLFNVLLTVFSIILSVIVSHFYFEASRQQTISEIKEDYKKNNKLYSQKAAEKVDNLSNELNKLSIYLQGSLDDSDLEPEVALVVQEEKIRSAIHIVQTLKSVNDRSLSDWLGVFDEADITEQTEIREEIREEQEESFRSILDKYHTVIARTDETPGAQSDDTGTEKLDNVQTDINELSKRIDQLATSIVGTPVKVSGAPIKKERVLRVCPNCEHTINYRQRPSENSVRMMKCPICKAKIESRYNSIDGFTLTLKELPPTEAPKEISEELVATVQKALPPQPWPKGTSHLLAEKLALSHMDVRRAMDELVRRGDVFVQIDGVLYEPKSRKKPTQSRRPKNVKSDADESKKSA